MEHRELGRTGMRVSAIGFGAWAIGADWGPTDDEASMRALHAAIPAEVHRLTALGGPSAKVAAFVLIACELGLGLTLVLGYDSLIASLSAGGLFALFAIVLAANIIAGNAGRSCGCFGARSKISWPHVLRNMGIGLLALGSHASAVSAILLSLGVTLLGLTFVPLQSRRNPAPSSSA